MEIERVSWANGKGYRWVAFTVGENLSPKSKNNLSHTLRIWQWFVSIGMQIHYLFWLWRKSQPSPKWNEIHCEISKYTYIYVQISRLHTRDNDEKFQFERRRRMKKKNNNNNNFRNKSFNARVLITCCLLLLSTHRLNVARTGYSPSNWLWISSHRQMFSLLPQAYEPTLGKLSCFRTFLTSFFARSALAAQT